MTHRIHSIAAAALVLALAAGPVHAQQGGGSGGSDGKRMQALIQDIRELMQRAEDKRQADPWLIEDVREVLAKYDFPWQRTVYASHFRKQVAGAPEPWRVISGEFRVDGRGLHTLVPTAEELAAAQDRRGETSREPEPEAEPADRNEQMRELLGAVLDQALGGGQRADTRADTRERERTAPPEPVAGRAVLPKGMANAFALRLKFTAKAPRAGAGSLAIGPYQGEQAEAGYRLVYRPDASEGAPAFELTKRGPRGTESTVALSDGAPEVADGKPHSLLWTRDRDGRMQIDLDGTTIVEVTDRAFGDPFAGLVVHNAGGDYAFDSLVIKDAS